MVGCKVELVFSPFDLDTIEVHCTAARRAAVPHVIPATPIRKHARAPVAPARTGIDYLALVADAHDSARAGASASTPSPARQGRTSCPAS